MSSNEKDLNERVAVLEVKVDDQGQKIDHFLSKLDVHMTEETENDIKLRSCIQNLTTEIAKTNGNLEKISNTVNTNNIKLIKIDTIWATVAKIAGIMVLVATGTWAVVEFYFDHKPAITETQKNK